MVSPVRTGESQFAFADAVSWLANKRTLLNADDSRDTLGSAATRTHTHTRARTHARMHAHTRTHVCMHGYAYTDMFRLVLSVSLLARLDFRLAGGRNSPFDAKSRVDMIVHVPTRTRLYTCTPIDIHGVP